MSPGFLHSPPLPQGTGAVVAAGVANAAKIAGVPLREQRIVFYGAGSAARGVADTLRAMMLRAGMTDREALDRFYFVDSRGLVTTARDALPPSKALYARSDLPPLQSLQDIVKAVHPTALIGLSTVPDAFTQEVA